MKKLTVLFFSALMSASLSTSVLASHQNHKRPVVHNDPQRHYKGKDYKFRYGDHDNYNPHHRKCGYMPSGSC